MYCFKCIRILCVVELCISGSQLYDYSLYLIVGAVVFLFFLFLASCLFSERSTLIESEINTIVKFQHMKFSISGDIVRQFPVMKTIVAWCNTLWNHIKFMILLNLVFIITSAPIYVIRIVNTEGDHSYSSHWNVYSWLLSFAYLKGDLMGVMSFCVWVLTAITYFAYIVFFDMEDGLKTGESENSAPVESSEGDQVERWKIREVLVSVVNLTVSLLVNIFYILSITDQSLSSTTSIIIRLGVALYRLVSSAIIIPFLVKEVKDPMKKYLLEFRMIILNNVVIPCVVTALTSSNCFQVCVICDMYKLELVCICYIHLV